jgi:hypothetical protein
VDFSTPSGRELPLLMPFSWNLADLAHHQLGEVAALDAAGGVEIDDAALEHAAHDVGHGRVVAKALGAGHGRGDGPHLHVGRVLGIAARPLELLGIPGLDGLGIGRDPVAGHLQHLLRRFRQRVQDALLDRLFGAQLLAFQHQRQAGLDADQPRQTLGAAATRQQAQLDFRQAELGFWVVERDAVVAGQRQLQPAAQRGAVERRHHRPAAGFQAAQEGLVLLGHGEGFGRIGDAVHLVDVGAGEELLLARGEDHALDAGVRLDARDGLGKGTGEFLVEHVHGTARHVEGQGDDAIGILVEFHCGHMVSLEFSLRRPLAAHDAEIPATQGPSTLFAAIRAR